jgi:hypothetical protein
MVDHTSKPQTVQAKALMIMYSCFFLQYAAASDPVASRECAKVSPSMFDVLVSSLCSELTCRQGGTA